MEDSHRSGLLIAAAIIVVLIIINGMLASAEIAFMGLKETLLKKNAGKGDRKAASLLKMKQHPSDFLSTIQIGITLAGLLSGAFAADTLAGPIVLWAQNMGVSGMALSAVRTVSLILVTLILTFIMLVFGELVPKRLAMVRPEKTAYRVVGFIKFLSVIAHPLVRLLSVSTNGILKILKVNPSETASAVTEEEILLMVQEGTERGTIENREAEFVSNSFAFTDLTVKEVMTHRTEITALPADAVLPDVIALMANTPHARYPVYEGTIDKIIGVLYVQDIVRLYPVKDSKFPSIREIMRSPFFVSGSKPLVQLFDDMKKSDKHLAVVVDEYGGTSGIVTLMDMIEEIIGDVGDTIQEDISRHEDGSFSADGLAEMEDLLEFLNLDGITVDKNQTLSGYIIDVLGFVPDPGQYPEIRAGEYLFKVEKANGPLIQSVHISKIPVPEAETGGKEL
ncbi:hemolysin family protein [Treponema sp. OttesenSCG-928-L16]|nr:hemolysin family protein [Treponema sp. OttesenSCG-928-L16]